MLRSIWYLFVLLALVAAAFILPKVVQKSEKFAPLAEKMASSLTPPPPPPLPPDPEPTVAVVPDPPPVPQPIPEPDLSPVINALASGDLAKADALLDLMKDTIPAEKLVSLKSSVDAARKREAEAQAKESAKPAVDPAALQAQTVMLEGLKQLQQTQKETAAMLASLKETQTKVAPVAAAPALDAATLSNDTPLPGTVSILFQKDSSFLPPKEAEKLKPVLEALTAAPKLKVELRGFADKSGNTDYNLGLSRARATAVKDAFRRAGVGDSRISMLPMGSFQAPAVASEADAALMRKVEVLVVNP